MTETATEAYDVDVKRLGSSGRGGGPGKPQRLGTSAENGFSNPVALASGAGSKLSPEQEADVVTRFLAGDRVELLAQDVGVHWTTVYDIAKRHNATRPRIRTPRQRPWVEAARLLFESGQTCRIIGERVGVAEKTVMQEASAQGWTRRQLCCYKCGAAVAPSKKKNSADRRVCVLCARKRYQEKAAKQAKSRTAEQRQKTRRRTAERLGKAYKPIEQYRAELNDKRARKPRSPFSELGRYRYYGEFPKTQAGALLALRDTLRKLLVQRCESEGLLLDSVEYKAKYAADPAFRERERLRTSGKRWGNRADGRDDGTLTKEAVRRLFAKAKKCPYCWQPMKSQDKSLDHMEPLSLGGWHSLNNVLVCCRRCNSRKSDSPWIEWLGKIPAACEKALRETAA